MKMQCNQERGLKERDFESNDDECPKDHPESDLSEGDDDDNHPPPPLFWLRIMKGMETFGQSAEI